MPEACVVEVRAKPYLSRKVVANWIKGNAFDKAHMPIEASDAF